MAYLDPLALEPLEGALDRPRLARSDHQPEQRRGEHVLAFAIDEHDAVLARQALAERARGDDAADSSAEDHHGLGAAHQNTSALSAHCAQSVS